MTKGNNLSISTKHSIAICKFIKGKKTDKAIKELEAVILMKKAIPMKGEIPHRKGDIMAGRYPINASKVFIKLLKNLEGNARNAMGIENPEIKMASATMANRPYGKFGRQKKKRTNVILKTKI